MESVREILQGEKLEIILQLNRDLEEKCHIIHSLLRHAGQRGLCPRCGERIVYIRHAEPPMVVPYNPDGNPHATSCSKAFTHEVDHGG